jgi:hypothetical protein
MEVELVDDLSLKSCRYGHLLVLRRIPDHFECGCRRWRAQCDCGNVVETYESALVEGRKISCGCQNQAKQSRSQWAA